MSAIRHWDGKRWKLFAAVIMPDHVHVLAEPLGKGDGRWDLGEIIHSVKGFSAHAINEAKDRLCTVWQSDRFDRIVRDRAEFLEKWEYIAKNPIKTGLAKTIDDYAWLYLLEELPEGRNAP